MTKYFKIKHLQININIMTKTVIFTTASIRQRKLLKNIMIFLLIILGHTK